MNHALKLIDKVSARKSEQDWPFVVKEDGIYWLKSNQEGGPEPVKLASRVDVVAKTRSSEGENWGRLLQWRDDEGRHHQWAMPMEALATDAGSVRARLLSEGVFVTSNKGLRERFTDYLLTAPTENMARSVTQVGWHGDTYVMPDMTIGPNRHESTLYQSPHDAVHYWRTSGTFDEWRTYVGDMCSGNSRLLLAASCAFAGPLLSQLNVECGGVHFYGGTSSGKSTALMVGGSVCGGGGPSGFIQTWRATVNGFEAMAEAHNDSTLFLDELAQVDPYDAAETAYLLSNGQGKSRVTRNLSAGRKLTWRLLFVSAGELTLAEHAASVGKKTKGGVEVWLLNINADAGCSTGIFEDLHGHSSPDAFSRMLKEQARRYYGSPLREFIRRLVGSRTDAERFIKDIREAFLQRCTPSQSTGEVKRAADRFSLIGAAGELATHYGLTGWQECEADFSAKRCFQEWLTQRGTIGASDTASAIRQVRAFLEAHGSSRFQLLHNEHGNQAEAIHNRAGFCRTNRDTGETEYFILTEVFRSEVCKGLSYRTVASELAEHKLLVREEPHWTIKRTIPELGSVRMYCVCTAVLDDEC